MSPPVRYLSGGEHHLMAWARIDDGFDDHPKLLALLDADEGAVTAVGLWTLCLTWAHRNTRKKGKTPGLIPAGLPRRFLGAEGRAVAKLLVAHGLWDEAPDGWLIHDFADYLPSDETREARSAAGKRGAAKRWASKQAQNDGSVEANEKQDDGNLPSGCHDDASNAVANDGSRAGAHRAISNEIAPTPTPVPGEEPSVLHETSEAAPPTRDLNEGRVDVERICVHLADRIEANGSKRPSITKTWRDNARLLIDKDGRTEQQIHTAIDWCQDSEFWQPNIMSMPTLREKYDQLRLQAKRQNAGRDSPSESSDPQESTSTQRARAAIDAGKEVQAMLDRGELTA